MLKTGITTGSHIIPGTNKCDYKLMAERGYSCCDYSGISNPESPYYKMDDEQLKAAMQEERKLADEAGITITQVHGTWPVIDTTEELRAQNLEAMKTCVRATSFLGTKYLVVHPLMPYQWNDEPDPDFAEQVNEKFFRELCTYALEWNVGICIENMPTKKHRLAGIPNLVKFVKRLDLPNFFICLDTGHCHVAGHDSGEMVRLCGDLLKVFHIHDNSGFRDEHMVPYFGKIDWESFKQGVKDSGYSGSISMECTINSQLPPELRNEAHIITAKIARHLADI